MVHVHEAAHIERLAYTRTQAAEALGVSRSTFDRRVLPYIETAEMPWGKKLIPVDELERFLDERRRSGRSRPEPGSPGRRPAVSAEVVQRIRAERSCGKSLAKIADDLTSDGVPTGHGAARWWPSAVRAVLARRSDQ
jgi:predicted DNA-binding transcriptional regulator AlpA